MIDREILRGRVNDLEALAEAAQAALGADEWFAGAHGAAATPKVAASGHGYSLSLSRSCRAAAGIEGVATQAADAHAALAAAGCEVDERVFGAGDSIWVVAARSGDEVVVKLASNGNRLVTAESRAYDDATLDEAATALA
ncbi:MAG: hypothetical protein ACTH31_16625 [Pseudoclavibacter sp.]